MHRALTCQSQRIFWKNISGNTKKYETGKNIIVQKEIKLSSIFKLCGSKDFVV